MNAKIDFYREQHRYVKHEQLFSDMKETQLRKLYTPYDSFLDQTVLNVGDVEFFVTDPTLASAISQLDTLLKTIILFYYFAGWTDKDIGIKLHSPRSTIQYQRNHALTLLRQILEKGE
ncbi:hypothetical protein AB1I62_03900 [Enterococcus sp. AN402]|uniref:hypothetical protein n=1 Tax=Enterococcus sp. AN402 TaxID=3151386 RepID=UPI003458FF1E